MGNLTLPEQSVTYHVQVSSTEIVAGGILRESKLSSVTTNATIFVPPPGKEFVKEGVIVKLAEPKFHTFNALITVSIVTEMSFKLGPCYLH